jgi:AhpD family alkylhydroperoxidase
MDAKTKEPVGISAAVAGHCQKCFSYHCREAEKLQIERKDIEEAIETAKAIRLAGNKGMDEFVKSVFTQKRS